MTTGNDATTQRIIDTLTPPLADLGFDLEAVELSPAGKRRMLRIAVDKDGGVTLDDVAEATRAINEVLDQSPVMGEQPYTLEVTSRGVDRPLTLPRHWRRNVTRLVKVTPTTGAVFTGRIVAADEESVTFEVTGRQRTVAIAEITKGMVQIEFNRPGPVAAEMSDEAEIDPDSDEHDEHDDTDVSEHDDTDVSENENNEKED
ncbi:ribosome maturation factor RimP [Nocardioides sp.]|uniref:ribosome maturation factor RimP n=1 Tax=Nocardioides sp. TaxID=35761 RepID=UPI00262D86EC|nr:ribosome maturation factor RimP [Nocardioides sp.]